MQWLLSHPKLVLWSLFLLLLGTIILQNVEPTQVDFLFWSLPQIPKLTLILVSMLAGCILTLLVTWELRSRRKRDFHDEYSDIAKP